MDSKDIYEAQERINANSMFGKMNLEQAMAHARDLAEGRQIAKEYVLTRKYVALMQDQVGGYDPEVAHGEADNLLCALLRELGFDEVVDLYEKVDKWYA